MGCGVSKLEAPNGKATTARLRPHFHLRIEDIKRRRHARSLNKATPSKKVLLRHGPGEDVGEITLHRNPLFNNTQKSTYSPEWDRSCVTSGGSKKLSENVESSTMKVNERIAQKVPLKGTIEGKVGNKKVEEAKDQNAEDGYKEDESRDDNNDERRIGHDKGVFPGSPSFRIYYTGNVDDHDKNESDNEDRQLEESTYDVQNTAQSKVALSSKGSTTRTAMKDGKTKGFRKVVMGK